MSNLESVLGSLFKNMFFFFFKDHLILHLCGNPGQFLTQSSDGAGSSGPLCQDSAWCLCCSLLEYLATWPQTEFSCVTGTLISVLTWFAVVFIDVFVRAQSPK